MRKHVVKLKSSWDPKLVSKEVRQLDNTISMFNLVYVCTFCAQFFDPDFTDGIAYPTRIPPPIIIFIVSSNHEMSSFFRLDENCGNSSSETLKENCSSIVTSLVLQTNFYFVYR
jgi:hypothetical protein